MKFTISNIRETDIYLIDQILKGNLNSYRSVLDVGCGSGRNLPLFIDNDFDVFGVEPNKDHYDKLRDISGINMNNFLLSKIENMYFDRKFDFIICNAVLHFSNNQSHFAELLNKIWFYLQKDGILFIRTASDIGIEKLVHHLGDGNYKLPDGSTRFLVNQEILLDYTNSLGGELVEKIKTTNVQNLRAMTTWIIKKI